MPDSSDFLHHLLLQLAVLGKLSVRNMFGGQYIYCDNLFFATIHDGELYFKANANTAPEFIALNRPLFSYPRAGGIATLQYYKAPQEVFSSPGVMMHWARLALLAARQDAQKKEKKSPKSTRRLKGASED